MRIETVNISSVLSTFENKDQHYSQFACFENIFKQNRCQDGYAQSARALSLSLYIYMYIYIYLSLPPPQKWEPISWTQTPMHWPVPKP